MSGASYIIRYALSLGLILFSLPAATVAIDISYSTPTQCGPFNVTWEDSAILFDLLILPFDARAIIVNGGSAARYDNITKTYTYTVDKLPLASGSQFVVAMDYGFSEPLSALADTFRSAHTTLRDVFFS